MPGLSLVIMQIWSGISQRAPSHTWHTILTCAPITHTHHITVSFILSYQVPLYATNTCRDTACYHNNWKCDMVKSVFNNLELEAALLLVFKTHCTFGFIFHSTRLQATWFEREEHAGALVLPYLGHVGCVKLHSVNVFYHCLPWAAVVPSY